MNLHTLKRRLCSRRNLLLALIISSLLFHPHFLHAQEDGEERWERNGEGIINEGNREEDEGFREEREAWIREMNRTEPGVDAELLNQQIRRAKLEELQSRDSEKGNRLSAEEEGVRFSRILKGIWTERGSSNQAGRTRAADIDFQNRMIYVGADGGQVWQGTLEGKEWRALNDARRMSDIRMVRFYRNEELERLVVLDAKRLYYSDDRGETWNEATGLEEVNRYGSFRRGVMARSEEGTIYLTGYEWDGQIGRYVNGLYVSTDHGTSFTRQHSWLRLGGDGGDVSSPPGVDWAYFVHDDSISQAFADGTIRSVAAPFSFSGDPTTDINTMWIRSTDESSIAFYTASPTKGRQMFISLDSGKTLELSGTPPVDLFDPNSFAASSALPGLFAIGAVELYRTENTGMNWTQANGWGEYYGRPETRLHADIPWIDFIPTPQGEEVGLVSTDGGLYISYDGMQSFRNLSLNGLHIGQYYSVYTSRVDTNIVFAGAQDQGFQRSTKGGKGVLDFDQTYSGDYGHINSGDGGRTVWTNYPGFTMYYPDALRDFIGGGITLDFPTRGHLWFPPVVVDPDTPTVAYVTGGGAKDGSSIANLIRMEYIHGQLEATLLPFEFSPMPGVNLTAMAISPVRTDDWYAMTSAQDFYYSSDRGTTWKKRGGEGIEGHYFYGANILPSRSKPGRLYLAGSGYSNPGVWVSDDNGITFTPLDTGLPPTLVFDIDASTDDRYLFAATAVGPYFYLADSARWYDASQGDAPDQTYWSVDYIEQNRVARFGTYGRGIWDMRLVNDTVSGLQEPTISSRSTNPSIRPIESEDGTGWNLLVEQPASSEAAISIFNINGDRVADLYSGMLQQGSHRFHWDGRSGRGELLPSGSYLTVIRTLGTISYGRILLTR